MKSDFRYLYECVLNTTIKIMGTKIALIIYEYPLKLTSKYDKTPKLISIKTKSISVLLIFINDNIIINTAIGY